MQAMYSMSLPYQGVLRMHAQSTERRPKGCHKMILMVSSVAMQGSLQASTLLYLCLRQGVLAAKSVCMCRDQV